MRNFVREVIATLVLAIVIFLLLRLVVGSYTVISESMQPGLQIGERLLINKLAFNFTEPTRGELVYYKSPNGDLDQLKRVIGLPNDVVQVKDNAVYVNGIKLTEPYVKDPPAYGLVAYQVPPNNYFVLGDNRNNSNDSATGWTVPRENIMGRAWIFTWPPDKWGVVDSYALDSQITSAKTP
jgi:signal peptidase I